MAIVLGISTAHPLGESATCPRALPRSALAALLLLAGARLPRRRALPAHYGTAHAGTFNCGFQDYRSQTHANAGFHRSGPSPLIGATLNRSTAPYLSPYPVIPAQAGIQLFRISGGGMDSRLRGNDG
jgi:hypothetical protein